ncbi:MAG: hypothetical protein R3D00_11830 [Bacteroidia bacterium]
MGKNIGQFYPLSGRHPQYWGKFSFSEDAKNARFSQQKIKKIALAGTLYYLYTLKMPT